MAFSCTSTTCLDISRCIESTGMASSASIVKDSLFCVIRYIHFSTCCDELKQHLVMPLLSCINLDVDPFSAIVDL